MSWKENIVQALENLNGIATYDKIYDEVYKIKKGNVSSSWKETIRRRIQDLSSDSNGYKGKEDIFYSVDGIGNGIWGLRKYLQDTPQAVDLIENEESTKRVKTTTHRIIRDTNLSKKIKLLHSNKCQICETTILINDKTYSEAHHIKPLGSPHDGLDKSENLIILCPNCHVLCDYGGIKLNINKIKNTDIHNISKEYINYHNNVIFNKIL